MLFFTPYKTNNSLYLEKYYFQFESLASENVEMLIFKKMELR